MTIGIGIICADESRVVLASDTMVTNQALSLEFEHENQKVTKLSENCVALTAGDALAHTELFGNVRSLIAQLRQPSVVGIVENIKNTYQTIRKRQIEERILKPKGFESILHFYQIQTSLIPDVAMSIQIQIDQYKYGLEILVAGVDNGQAHIYGISDPGTSYCFDSIGFHAVGSGAPHALNTLIAKGANSEVAFYEALMIVYEAKKISEKAPGVGGTVTDISFMDSKSIKTIRRDSVCDLEKIRQRWMRGDDEWSSSLEKLLKNNDEQAAETEH